MRYMKNMAEIKNAVVFCDDQNSLIQSIVSDSAFHHHDWNNETYKVDLQSLRAHIRDHYRVEQQGKCAYCQKDMSTYSALNCHVEHIVPKSKHVGFMFSPKNLCVACADCNHSKSETETLTLNSKKEIRKQYPRASSGFHIVHPHFDTYSEHINIFQGKWYIDKTSKGHFTIGTCKLNQRNGRFGIADPDNELLDLVSAFQDEKAKGNQSVVNLIKSKMLEIIDS